MSYRILSIDGGGVRGLIPAIWLSRLEERLSRPLCEVFDLVAGTSTGAILACCVAAGLSTQEVVKLYRARGYLVFPPRWWRGLRQRWLGPKYDAAGLEGQLREVFQDTRLGDLKIPVIVPAYAIYQSRPVIFDSANPDHARLKVRDVCQASAAAPMFLPPAFVHLLRVRTGCVDGGVGANNPVGLALAWACEITGNGFADYTVASFGTGNVEHRATAEDAAHWGMLKWILPLIHMMFDAQSDVEDIKTQKMVPDYHRLQITLAPERGGLDDASRENLRALSQLAIAYLASTDGRNKMDALVKRLEASQ